MKKIILIVVSVLFLTGCSNFTISKHLRAIDDALVGEDLEVIMNAVADAEEYLEDHEDAFELWDRLGDVYTILNDYEKAENCFNNSIKANANSDYPYIGMGKMYRQKGDIELAKESYLKAIEILPENAEAYSSLSVLEFLQENYQEAVTYGEEAWAINKDSAAVAANLALAYHYNENFGQRDKMYQVAKDLNYSGIDALTEAFGK